MTWDWTLLLVVDAAALVLATLVILGLFVRDLRAEGASGEREGGDTPH